MQTAIAHWRARMGWTQRAAASALGISLPAYQQQERGQAFSGQPRKAKQTLLLACAALEHGLPPLTLEHELPPVT